MTRYVALLGLLLWTASPAPLAAQNSGYAVAREALTPEGGGLDQHGTGVALPCTVLSYPPELGFDFRFHARYVVILRRKDFRKGGDALSTVLHISPANDPGAPVNIVQQLPLPRFDQPPEGE